VLGSTRAILADDMFGEHLTRCFSDASG